MPSPDARSVDLPIAVLGGRVTQFDPQTLPAGASPFCQDVIFSGANNGGELVVGAVGSRPGMQSLYAPFAGNPTINYLRTFVDSVGNPHQLILDGLGVVRDDFPEATFTTIGQVIAGAFAQSDTYAGKEWLAIGDGKFGIDIPRRYDGTNFYRVSQVGPGAAPSATDENIAPFNIVGSPNGLIPYSANMGTITETGNIVTVTPGLPLPTQLKVGDYVHIAGVATAGYNGDFTVTAIVSATKFQYTCPNTGLAADNTGTVQYAIWKVVTTAAQSFQAGGLCLIAGAGVAGYNGTWFIRSVDSATQISVVGGLAQDALVASGGGTVTQAGNISAGLHGISVAFILDDGTITTPAIPGFWTATGLKRVVVANIPTGPSNVVGRVIMFTPVITAPALTGPFFYLSGPVPTPSVGTFPSMIIQDNSTLTITLDFLDSVLQAGTAASNLFNLLELGECSGVRVYSERTCWTGERNKVNSAGGGGGFNNLTFDGGFNPLGSGVGPNVNYPLGWTVDVSAGIHQSTGSFGGAYQALGDGATTPLAQIHQTAAVDYLGVPILRVNTAYSVRIRARYNPGGAVPAQGRLVVEIFSPSGGSLGLFSVLANTLTASFVEYSGVLLASQIALASDIQLRLYVDQTLTNGAEVEVDFIEPYPTLQPINRTVVRISYAFQPQSFDGTTGFMIVGKDNGQAVRGAFKLLDKKVYVVKERSLYGSQDDGANEPSLWALDPISQTVGTPSVNGFDVAGEAWAVIAAHDGLYIFWGAEPMKISQEIQPDWDTINWNAGQALWVVVDSQNKRIHVGAPTGNATKPNAEFVMDYSQLNDAADIAASPQAHYAYFNPSNIVAPGRARKWTTWNLSNNCGALTFRADGSYHLLRGNAAGNGKIYDQVATQTSDDGVAIDALYQTYYFPNGDEELQLQQIIGGHRRLVKFLTGYAFGSGVMTWSVHGQQDNRIVPLSSLTLSNPAKWDFEKNVNFPTERASLIFGTNAVGAWWHLSKVKPTVTKDTMLVRGVA